MAASRVARQGGQPALAGRVARRSGHRPAPASMVRGPLAAALLCVLAGCGTTAGGTTSGVTSPASAPPPGPTALPVASTQPVLPSAPVRSPSASPTAGPPSFADGSAVSCSGYPPASRVIAVLRAERVISRSASVTATTGPLCAGGWQYTVVSEAGREPLQVVTRGSPGNLVLVTAGTDVCTPMVVTQAPRGITAIAHC